jgi:hypothetical protein
MTWGMAQGFTDPIEDYAGWWFKAYAQGTTTPISIAFDSAGATTAAKVEVSSGGTVPIGFIKSAGDAIVQMWFDQAYDLWIIPTEAEADANDLSNAEQIADNVLPAELSAGETIASDTDRRFDTISDMVTNGTDLVLGQYVSVAEHTTGNLSGVLFGQVVAAGTGTANNGSYVDLPNTTPALQWEQIFPEDITINMFGASPSGTAAANTTAIQNCIDFGRSKMGAVDGTYTFNDITVGNNQWFVGSNKVIFKCGSATTEWITYQVSGGKGFQGGFTGITVNGNDLADWGFFVDSWRGILFDDFVAQGFLKGLFDLTSNQLDNSEFGLVRKVNLDFVIGNVTTGRTPRFARGRLGTTGNLTEYYFEDCTHLGITNAGTVGINASTGISSDTAGIGIELINCNRCRVDKFMCGNNQDTGVGSYDTAVYVQGEGTSGNAFTGQHVINDIYAEQAGATPTVIAIGVIVNANGGGTRVVDHVTIENVKMSRSGAGVTYVHMRNDSATVSRNQNTTYTNKRETLSNVDNVIIDEGVVWANLDMTFPASQIVGITDNGTETVLTPEYEIKSGTDYFDAGAAQVDFDIDFRDDHYETTVTQVGLAETLWRLNKFKDLFSVRSSNGSSTIEFEWSAKRKVLQPPASIVGTATKTIDEADVIAGGKTIVIKIVGDTWVSAGAPFDAVRQDIIDGLDSAQSEATGWNNEVRDKEVVTAVVRTTDNTVTVTLAAAAAYDITAQETITVTVPASALENGTDPLTAGTFTVEQPSASIVGTATQTIDEADVVAGGKTIVINIAGDTWVSAGATFNAVRQDIIDGLDSAQSEATGWNNEVRDKEVVTAVVRTTDNTVTVTLAAAAAYDITAQETITVTVPASALENSTNPLTAGTFTVDFV